MNNLDEMIEILKAAKDGKDVEFQDTVDGEWKNPMYTLGIPWWNFSRYNVRVKPKTK
jgi:hypothetical protein